MSKRKLYPPSRIDRGILWFALILILAIDLFTITWPHYRQGQAGWGDVIGISVSLLLIWVFVYFIQDLPKDEFENYTASIAKIESIGKQLTELVNFLKQERQKVAESEATLIKLEDERTKLEPVVLAQRDTVNAILTAHARTTASRVWKERALGFLSGLLASLLAAMVIEHFRH